MKIARAMFILFFMICIGVHVYGLIVPFSTEPPVSHLIHLISYSVCLLVFLRAINFRFLIYVLASCYPFAYHAHCAWVSWMVHSKLNGICLLVVVMLPLGAVWLWKAGEK